MFLSYRKLSSLESPYKTDIHFFLVALHGDHGHIKEITNAFTISQIEEIIFLTWWRAQSDQGTKYWNRRCNTLYHTTNEILKWTIHILHILSFHSAYLTILYVHLLDIYIYYCKADYTTGITLMQPDTTFSFHCIKYSPHLKVFQLEVFVKY